MVLKARLIFWFLLLSVPGALAQSNRYMVFLSDKACSPHTLQNPSTFLSERALQRRLKMQIEVTERDLPVCPDYVQALRQAGARAFFTSRWWNAVMVESESSLVSTLAALPFVTEVLLVAPGTKLAAGGRVRRSDPARSARTRADATGAQLIQLGIDQMHRDGYRGEGIRIAIFDSGFPGVSPGSPYYAHLFEEGRVGITFNFVRNTTSVFEGDVHGAEVFSVLAADWPGQYTGVVPKAHYDFFVTEDVPSEYRIEEFNWTLAAERADSAGVDIVNSSLGYYDFDDPSMNYTLGDLTGDRAVVSQAARWLTERGVLVVTSAGNEGNFAWRRITFPADVQGVLAVGAVTAQGLRVSFSSIGPTADNRIKPDVMACGASTVVVRANGTVGTASGTSLASPLVAGLAAGILQARPELSGFELYGLITQSGSQADRPDFFHGFGIPHYTRVMQRVDQDYEGDDIVVYPNPVSGNILHVRLTRPGELPVTIALIDNQGRMLRQHELIITWRENPLAYDVTDVPPGLYLLQITTSRQVKTVRVVRN